MKRWLVVLVVLFAGCGGSSAKTASPTTTAAETTTTTVPMRDQAIAACQTAVKAQLKSPASAVFEADEPVQTRPGVTEGGFDVAGTVDSQNGFGAVLRNIYLCNALLSQKPPPVFVALVPVLRAGNSLPANFIDDPLGKKN